MSKIQSSGKECSPPGLPSAALVIGCGYLGRYVADQLQSRGVTVAAIVRSDDHARSLVAEGLNAVAVDVSKPDAAGRALELLNIKTRVDVYYLIPPGMSRQRTDGDASTVLSALNHVISSLSALSSERIGRVIVASSTGVYCQSEGECVEADTNPTPEGAAVSARSQLLLDIETAWLSSSLDSRVVRLAGLYGAGRIVGQAVREGKPIGGDPDAWLNLIHVEDAADLMIAVAKSANAHRIELGSDGSPVRRLTYYQHVAKCLGAPDVKVSASDGDGDADLSRGKVIRRGASSKRCDNTLTCQRVGWQPRYGSYVLGLAACGI
jgi:nucleoside-diphosphate-sugar epimerase